MNEWTADHVLAAAQEQLERNNSVAFITDYDESPFRVDRIGDGEIYGAWMDHIGEWFAVCRPASVLLGFDGVRLTEAGEAWLREQTGIGKATAEAPKVEADARKSVIKCGGSMIAGELWEENGKTFWCCTHTADEHRSQGTRDSLGDFGGISVRTLASPQIGEHFIYVFGSNRGGGHQSHQHPRPPSGRVCSRDRCRERTA